MAAIAVRVPDVNNGSQSAEMGQATSQSGVALDLRGCKEKDGKARRTRCVIAADLSLAVHGSNSRYPALWRMVH